MCAWTPARVALRSQGDHRLHQQASTLCEAPGRFHITSVTDARPAWTDAPLRRTSSGTQGRCFKIRFAVPTIEPTSPYWTLAIGAITNGGLKPMFSFGSYYKTEMNQIESTTADLESPKGPTWNSQKGSNDQKWTELGTPIYIYICIYIYIEAPLVPAPFASACAYRRVVLW